ncbi:MULTISPECIES: hypothetical protein [unclassified Variovorax]|uniref:hypothetical protein n=1 Tax=unclassified Variovorax TaxID=663243 RepID=UPI003ECC5192
MRHRRTALCATLILAHAMVFAQPADTLPADASSAMPEVVAPLPAAGEGASAPSADPIQATLPKVEFSRGSYREGIETLRIVRREDTSRNIAVQVGLNVALIALTVGAALSARGFSKDDLAGTAVEGLDDERLRDNPARAELPQAIGLRLAQLYRERAAAGEPVPEDEQAPVRVTPGPWHLVYESLMNDDQLFRLKWGAAIVPRAPRMFRMPKRPVQCAYESEPATLADWQADDWRRLRDERVKALDACDRPLDEGLKDML